ncbi:MULTISPECIES: SseB family protein, partial [unclassified Streptomyces]|uniref:SseB family protein n=1 Tax=unclassified Streptomyces TaxID=2593676 RepID=UPI00114CB195
MPDPGFADDDGSAAPALAAALADYARDRTTPRAGAAERAVVAALHGARLLVPVVALLGEAETGPDGLRREKTSDMAVPTIQAPDGRRALPAFTSTASLARWRPDARP